MRAYWILLLIVLGIAEFPDLSGDGQEDAE